MTRKAENPIPLSFRYTYKSSYTEQKIISKAPFVGCTRCPKDRDESQSPVDIAKIKGMGITCARIGEFALAKMEPFPDK